MKAVVLAGGFATRLRPISYALPKLLFPILGKPMIYWTLDLLRNCDVDEVVLAVNYLADSLQANVGNKYRGMRIRYSLENKPLGTAGPMRLASHATKMKETFIAMNGDVIAQIDLNKMLMMHLNMNAAVTDALHEVQDPSRFGVVQIDPDSRIRKFVEKPSLKEAPSRLINAGIYLVEPAVLGMIPSGQKVSLEREIFPILAKRRKLVGFPFEGHWFDIGSLSDYRKANFALLQEQVGELAAGSRFASPFLIGKRSTVHRSAFVGPNALLGRDCLISKRARVMNSILFDSVTVGEESSISGAIVASNVSIGEKVKVENGAVISSDVKISDGVKIGRNTVIHPHKEITTSVGVRANVM